MNDFCTRCGNAYQPGDQFCGKCGTPKTAPVMAAAPPPPQPIGGVKPVSGLRVLPLIIGLIVPGAIGFAVLTGFGGCEGEVEGNMRVAGARGDFTFTPTGCVSLQPYGRFGANIHAEGPNDGAVYVTNDPTRGPSVEIEIPGSCRNADGTDCTVFPVPRDRCQTWQARVSNTSTTVNDVRLVEGNVQLQCTLEDGTTVQGRIVFDSCGI